MRVMRGRAAADHRGMDGKDAPAPPSHPPMPTAALRERATIARSRSRELCGPLVSQAELAVTLAELQRAPLAGSTTGLGELADLAAVARMQREDLRMLEALLTAIESMAPDELAAALWA